MVNQDSINAVNSATYADGFVRPLYDSYCYYQLPGTIQNLLGARKQPGLPLSVLPDPSRHYDTVILFFIDAFGWRFFQQHSSSYPFLQHFTQSGVVSRLTSQFPSTTAAHVTTIHTGLAPAQSGVYEWHQYEPLLNNLIAPLMFNIAGESTRDTLSSTGLDVSEIFPAHTIYERLSACGVKSSVFQSEAFARSVPSRHLLTGAETVPFKTFPEALVQLAKRLKAQEAPSYYLLYLSTIDSLCHTYGPDSPEVEAEIDTFLVSMERLLLDRLAGKYPRALLMLTADHGMTAINPATTVYLNQHDSLRRLRPLLSTNLHGEPLVPAGSARDLFLHVKPAALDDAEDLLRRALSSHAMIVRTSELIKDGFFGPANERISQSFLERVGNLVLLPYKGESVYWHERGRFEQRFFGHHGGLTRDEMEIPLLTATL